MQSLSSGVAELNPLLWSSDGIREGSCHKNDTECRTLAVARGIFIIHIPAFITPQTAHSTQCPLLIYFLFIASISHTENSLEIDRVTSVQSLNRLMDAEDNRHGSLCVQRQLGVSVHTVSTLLRNNDYVSLSDFFINTHTPACNGNVDR